MTSRWDIIRDFSRANKIPLNANTRNNATHIAMACLNAGLSEEETKKIAISSANIFKEMSIDTDSQSLKREFDSNLYFETVMGIYTFLFTEAMFGESELASDLMKNYGNDV